MILSLSYQASLFLTTIGIGMFLGFIYDIFKIFRKVIPHKNIFIQIEDALYWLIVILSMFTFMLHQNYGEIRLFSIFGAFLGMLVYFLTVSKLVIKISDTVIYITKSILVLILTIILTPIRLFIMIFKKPAKKTGKFIQKKSKKILHLSRLCVKIHIKKLLRALHIILGKK